MVSIVSIVITITVVIEIGASEARSWLDMYWSVRHTRLLVITKQSMSAQSSDQPVVLSTTSAGIPGHMVDFFRV